jgi:hypothetical protein
MLDLRVSVVSLVLIASTSLACDSGGSDEGNDEVGDGDGDPGDGDGDPGDGDGDPSDGDGDPGDGDGEVEDFAALCQLGCEHFLACAPSEFAMAYADTIECSTACVMLYAACEPEATSYIQCFTDLSCEDVVVAINQGPAATACGSTFAAVQTACEL